MTPLETLLAPLRHSPRLIEAVDLLEAQIRAEGERRAAFYAKIEGKNVEFILGEVVGHSPSKNRELDASINLMGLLRMYVDLHGLGAVLANSCLCVFPRNDYEPDIVFFGREKAAAFGPDTMKFPIPDFIVEVLSESTEARDRGIKFEDYEAHGVREYWIVDAEREVVEQYVLRDGAYELVMKGATGELRSAVIAGVVVPVRAVFSQDENLAAMKAMAKPA